MAGQDTAESRSVATVGMNWLPVRRFSAQRAHAALATLCTVVSAIALGACGSLNSHQSKRRANGVAASTNANGNAATTSPPPTSSGLHAATIRISSSAAILSGGIQARYTCHGQNVSPPFKWHGVSEAMPNAKELLAFVRTINHGNISTNWAVAGIKPTTNGVAAGAAPRGAVIGRNSSGALGYSLCPPPGSLVTFAVYALPHTLNLKPGFDPEKVRPTLESSEVQWGGLTMVPYPPPKS